MASRSEVMLPPAGSEARWREEVMPGRASGEVMLALKHQEAKNQRKSASKLKLSDQNELILSLKCSCSGSGLRKTEGRGQW